MNHMIITYYCQMSKHNYLDNFLCGKPKCYYVNKIDAIKISDDKCKIYGVLDVINTQPVNYYSKETGKIFSFNKNTDGYRNCVHYMNHIKDRLNDSMKH